MSPEQTRPEDRRALLNSALNKLTEMQVRLDAAEQAQRQPVAVIGLGCRFPGGASSPDRFWELLRDGFDAVRDVPADRWNVDEFYDPDPDAPGKSYTRRGGFLDRIDEFEPQFFGISPREALTLDPQQRLILEVSWEALEHAGVPPSSLRGTSTGVFVGIGSSDYGQLQMGRGVAAIDAYTGSGGGVCFAAGRVSYCLGLQGPSFVVDTACSSSLVAVHLGCQSLRSGECNLALVGGVNVICRPDLFVYLSRAKALSPDGRSKVFDAAADGFVRGEGCGVVVLKRLSDALRDGDRVLAVIRGSAVNQDGPSSGLTVPNGPAQQSLITEALNRAGVRPADIDVIETHGTGTALGDPIETNALVAALGPGRTPDHLLTIASVKTNFGHLEAAAGIAGLIKTVLMLQHREIPPHLHFRELNPAISFGSIRVAIPTTLAPWADPGRRRIAGVSAFGLSGTNAHVVVEEAGPASEQAPGRDHPEHILALSARTPEALGELAGRYRDHLLSHPELSAADVSQSADCGRSHFQHRLAVVAPTCAEMADRLSAYMTGEQSALTGSQDLSRRPKVAFLFTGQGTQYYGMARALYESEPTFSRAFDRAATAFARGGERPLAEWLFAASADCQTITESARAQPALFAVEYALAELWQSWGIEPAVVIGHSLGEYAAACVAGVLSVESAATLVAARGRLMDELPPGGAMASIGADAARVEAAIAASGARVDIAALNAPEAVVVSGPEREIAALCGALSSQGTGVQRLAVTHAFHSSLIDPMLGAFRRLAEGVEYRSPRIPWMSTLTGGAVTSVNASYWVDQTRQPVRFAEALAALRARHVDLAVEIGPMPVLLGLARQCGVSAPGWVASLRKGRDDWREILTGLATLYVSGATVDWTAVERNGPRRRIALPTYPFQRERCWIGAAAPAAVRPLGHPLLGERRELAGSPGTFIWEQVVGLETHPWVRDHRVQNTPILPATAYIEMALRAAHELTGQDEVTVKEIENRKPMLLREGDTRCVQTTVVMSPDGRGSFRVHSRPAAGGAWTEHVTATIVRGASPTTGLSRPDPNVTAGQQALEGAAFYAALAAKGNEWGPSFQGLERAWIGDAAVIARIRVPEPIAHEMAAFQFHPALADASGHALVATVPLEGNDGATGGAFVGGGVGEVRLFQRPRGRVLWARASRSLSSEAAERNVIHGDVAVFDENGAIVSETTGARLWYLDTESSGELLGAPTDWFHTVKWERLPAPNPGSRRPVDGNWLVFADDGGIAHALADYLGPDASVTLVHKSDRFDTSERDIWIRPSEPDDYRRVLESGPYAAIVHLWSLGPSNHSASADTATIVNLVRAMKELRARSRIWLATRGAQAAVQADVVPAPLTAAVWGLGRTLAAEHADTWGGLVDLDPNASDGAAAAFLAGEVSTGSDEDKVAQRGEQRLAPRLTRQAPGSLRQVPITADATYLITGGLGGVGLAMASWLTARGARELVLIGRTGLPERERWATLDPGSRAARQAAQVRELEGAGARVQIAACDIADPAAIRGIIAARAAEGRPHVRGVVHAAGVLRLRPLIEEDLSGIITAGRGKVEGALALRAALAQTPLDFFALCSSTSALLPSPLLGAYAAANASLDALAHQWRAEGVPALSVNWGTWGEVGMAVDVESGRVTSGTLLRGVSPITTARGLAALEALLAGDTTQAAVMPVDWAVLGSAYPQFAADPFFAQLVASRDGDGETGPDVGALLQAEPEERRAMLALWLRAEAARVLGFGRDRLDPAQALSTLGFDSLMAVQLKNRLESQLMVSVPMVQLLQGPSVDQLAAAVLDLLPQAAPSSLAQDWEEGVL